MFSLKKTVSKTQEAPQSVIERRAAVRYASDQGASCALGHKAPRAWGKVRDISVLGVGLVLSREIFPGTRLVVEIARKNESMPLCVLAKVVRCKRESETTWIIGCQFDTALREEDVQELS